VNKVRDTNGKAEGAACYVKHREKEEEQTKASGERSNKIFLFGSQSFRWKKFGPLA
jgi:hypothetical protein